MGGLEGRLSDAGDARFCDAKLLVAALDRERHRHTVRGGLSRSQGRITGLGAALVYALAFALLGLLKLPPVESGQPEVNSDLSPNG